MGSQEKIEACSGNFGFRYCGFKEGEGEGEGEEEEMRKKRD